MEPYGSFLWYGSGSTDLCRNYPLRLFLWDRTRIFPGAVWRRFSMQSTRSQFPTQTCKLCWPQEALSTSRKEQTITMSENQKFEDVSYPLEWISLGLPCKLEESRSFNDTSPAFRALVSPLETVLSFEFTTERRLDKGYCSSSMEDNLR